MINIFDKFSINNDYDVSTDNVLTFENSSIPFSEVQTG